MTDYYADRKAAVQAMYPRTGKPYSWRDIDGTRWVLDHNGRKLQVPPGRTPQQVLDEEA